MRWLFAKLLYVPLLGLALFAAGYFYNVIVVGQGITQHLGVFLALFVAMNAIAWVQGWLLRPRRKRERAPRAPPRPEPLPVVEELPRSPVTPPERRFAVPPIVQGEVPTIAANASTMSPRLRRFIVSGDQAISAEQEDSA